MYMSCTFSHMYNSTILILRTASTKYFVYNMIPRGCAADRLNLLLLLCSSYSSSTACSTNSQLTTASFN